MLEEEEKRAISRFSPPSVHLLHFCQSSLPKVHSFTHFFTSYVLHIYCVPGTVLSKHWGGNDEDKTQISFSALVKTSHRLSIYFRIKTSLSCLLCRAPYVLAPDSIPGPTTHHFRQQTHWILCLSINMSGRNLPLSPAAWVFCLLSIPTSPFRAGLEMLPISLEKLFRISSYPAWKN